MSYEIVKENNINENECIPFLKWNYIDKFKLNNFKKNIKEAKKFYSVDKKRIIQISGLLENNEGKDKVDALIPYSFILYARIKLQSPYFSRDDEEFYLIQNQCLKDKAFKVPMIRGSGWKGAIANAGKDLINEKLEKGENVREYIQSYLRVFGTGSQEFRELEDSMIAYITKGKRIDWKHVLIFLLFELGMKVTREDIETLKNTDKIDKWLREKIWEDFCGGADKLPLFLQIHKGRVIFYPTYFDKLSLEIINPHSRKTRAGTNPIHYEMVPEGAGGILQIVYIPYNGVLIETDKLKNEIEKDIEFLTKCIKKTGENGIGAKTKLGWGRYNFEDRCYEIKGHQNLTIPNWRRCGG